MGPLIILEISETNPLKIRININYQNNKGNQTGHNNSEHYFLVSLLSTVGSVHAKFSFFGGFENADNYEITTHFHVAFFFSLSHVRHFFQLFVIKKKNRSISNKTMNITIPSEYADVIGSGIFSFFTMTYLGERVALSRKRLGKYNETI